METAAYITYVKVIIMK